MFMVMLVSLVSGDFALFSGAHVKQLWHSSVARLHAVQTLADSASEGWLSR